MVHARKLPIIIEAIQWRMDGDHSQVIAYHNSPLVNQYDKWYLCKHCRRSILSHGWIQSLEGGLVVCPSDWIIRGAHGEYYPIKNNIFLETYEVVKDETEWQSSL